MTDVHYDGAYTIGSLVDCPYPTCCGVDSGTPSESEKGAGVWGDYDDCDVPMHLLEATLDWIIENHVRILRAVFVSMVYQIPSLIIA